MPRSDKSIPRCLGEFVGHIYRGIKTKPGQDAKQRVEVGRRTETETRQTPRGPVTLRRTTIEEIELDPDRVDHPDEPRRP
jgi:hypothetical protein